MTVQAEPQAKPLRAGEMSYAAFLQRKQRVWKEDRDELDPILVADVVVHVGGLATACH